MPGTDAILVPLHASEHTYDFCKPVTTQALQRFDPELQLLRNRRSGNFEVHRRVKRARTFHIEGFGYLSYYEPMLIYVCDWTEGLIGSDDPTALIADLEAHDIVRHPEIVDAAADTIMRQRMKAALTVAGEYHHAFRDNRRLLYRAYEPLVNHPSYVR